MRTASHSLVRVALWSILLMASPAVAQSGREGIALRLVPGAAFTNGTFGDEDPRSEGVVGVTIGAQVVAPVSGSVGLSLEAIFQPYSVHNPHFDESFRTLYLMGGLEVALGTLYVRPNAGLAIHTWTGGSEAGAAGAIGLGVGLERHLTGNLHISPEFIARFAYEHGLSTILIGAQVGVGLRLAGSDRAPP